VCTRIHHFHLQKLKNILERVTALPSVEDATRRDLWPLSGPLLRFQTWTLDTPMTV